MTDWKDLLLISVATAGAVLCILFVTDCEKHCVDRGYDCIGNHSIITK